MGYVNPTLDSNMQPHPATATNDKDPTHLVATTAPILNLSGLKQATLKRAGVVEGEGTPKPHGCPESTSPFSAATLNAANALHETSRMSNISQRGTPTFAMPSPLNFVAQQSPAFMSANNPLLRTPSHAEATRKHADVAISNTPASTAARLFLPDADNNLPLRPSSAASVLHVDRAEFSRFVGHPGNIRMAANAPVASILVNQRNSRARSILREYPLPKEPLLHNPSGRDIQEHVLIPAEDEHEPESQFPGRPHFAATGKRSLDEDSGHEDSARAMTPGNYKRQRLYGTLDDSVWHSNLGGTRCSLMIFVPHLPFTRHKKRKYTATKTIILEWEAYIANSTDSVLLRRREWRSSERDGLTAIWKNGRRVEPVRCHFISVLSLPTVMG